MGVITLGMVMGCTREEDEEGEEEDSEEHAFCVEDKECPIKNVGYSPFKGMPVVMGLKERGGGI